MLTHKLNLKISTNKEGVNLVEARKLYEFLQSKQDFSTWIKKRINEYGFIENVDFLVFHKKMENSKGGRPAKEYSLTLDMAKELAMVERSELGRQARRYFIEAEKKLKTKTVKELPQGKKSLKKALQKHNISKIKHEFKNLIATYMQQPHDFKHSLDVLGLYDETNEFFNFVETLE